MRTRWQLIFLVLTPLILFSQTKNIGKAVEASRNSNEMPTKVRALGVKDQMAIKSLCEQQKEFNIFFLTSLNKLSNNQDLVEYWGQFNKDDQLVGVLMRYHVLWYIYDTPGTDLNAFARVIESKMQPRIIVNDNVRTTPGLVPLLKDYRVELDMQARLRKLTRQHFIEPTTGYSVRRATLDDVERLAEFYAQAPKDVRRGPDSIRRSVSGQRRTFLIEVDGEVEASALTTAELPDLAMIGGLHTSMGSHRQEYLLSVMAGLIRSLLDESKQVCVVTRDPLIDAACDQLGFEDKGSWHIVYMRHHKSLQSTTDKIRR